MADTFVITMFNYTLPHSHNDYEPFGVSHIDVRDGYLPSTRSTTLFHFAHATENYSTTFSNLLGSTWRRKPVDETPASVVHNHLPLPPSNTLPLR